jgi:drug/metabolite transporter (DMT)-like permease
VAEPDWDINLLGILFALTTAFVWGGGDFSGGLATRRHSQFQVLALSALSGIVLLVTSVVLWGESLPTLRGVLLAAIAGVSGATGVAALYRGLSFGKAASVAPTAAVVSAVLPVLFSMFTEGLPGAMRLAGFLLAFLGIWLVSRSSAAGDPVRQGILLACLAGVGFGGFFILIAQAEPGKVFTLLVVARLVSLGIALLMLRVRRLPLPSPGSNPIALLAGVLDAGGNVFYLLAKQFARLDVVVVLSSLCPAVTVLLARMVLKQDVSRAQWMGVGLCLIAVALIAV